ncbi:DUF6924 domain-containing protein [Aeromicrobium duanguangcaii]|uniref:DUF6924 domain-containing protein n=1 Tax=Aeromicrobium duanguangcaii TaxID=2968086 RepID=UPI0020182892|nr:hypothetical protein [Aeromicrobium duanguangcaii]MCL3837399.1 hypothetical protein [Aeromicrobium duanguangcaii]
MVIAARQALTDDEVPLLVIRGDGRDPHDRMRLVAVELASFETNVVQLSNLDWEHYADRVGPDGIFRGFGKPTGDR